MRAWGCERLGVWEAGGVGGWGCGRLGVWEAGNQAKAILL